MMSGGAPDCRAVSTRCGRPSETVTSMRMVMPGLAAMNLSASSLARASPQLGVHHTTSPADATAIDNVNVETAAASSIAGLSIFIFSPPTDDRDLCVAAVGSSTAARPAHDSPPACVQI